MKRKLLAFLAVASSASILCSCGGGYSDKVATIDDREMILHGPFTLADGETVNDWNGKADALYDASKMTATSLLDVSKIDGNVAKTLSKKDIKAIYKYEGAYIGFADHEAGWTKNFMDGEKRMKADGSFVFKPALCSYEADDAVWSEDQWIPNPKTAHAESLDGNMFIPTWSETKDDYGFSWADDSVVTSGAGIYTIVVAVYNTVSSAEKAGYGIACVKTAELEEGKGLTYAESPFVDKNAWGLIGKVNGVENWNEDTKLTEKGEGEYYSVVEFAAGDSFKFRANDDWDLQLGGSALPDGEVNFEAEDGGNIKCVNGGKYLVIINEKDGATTLKIKPFSYGIVGSENNWGDSADLPLVKGEGEVYSVELHAMAGQEFKIRVSDEWIIEYGSSCVANPDAEIVDVTDGNIKILVSGHYIVTLN